MRLSALCTAQLCLQNPVQAPLLSEMKLGIAAALASYVFAFNHGHSYPIVMGRRKGQGASLQNSSPSNVNKSCLAVMHILSLPFVTSPAHECMQPTSAHPRMEQSSPVHKKGN